MKLWNDIKKVWISSSLPYASDKRIEERLKSLLAVFKKAKAKASKHDTEVQDVIRGLFEK